MNSELLCRWLGLPDRTWPPDPHTLLGVAADERDAKRIEQQVHERMTKLRAYQIAHPEEATEGMNRVAQAFVQMMENGQTPPVPSELPVASIAPGETIVEAAVSDTFIERPTRSDWQTAPPPVRRLTESGRVVMVSPPPGPAPVDTLVRLGQESPEARMGLRTLPAVVERVERTRRLLHAWDRIGVFLRDPSRRLKKSDAKEFVAGFAEVGKLMDRYPAIVGRPGKPGYRVVAMGRLQMSPEMFRAVDDVQRELLAIDWIHGRKVLFAHRKYLHVLFKRLRRRGWVLRSLHAARSFLHDHPLIVLAGLSALGVVSFFWWNSR
ncbi:MAG TPA: hypothetical protein VHR72_11660 [Gemmataceae bacterium]|jgi:hypothetical protein|nr:hypothetical protein [Gemmataceae bacterium]